MFVVLITLLKATISFRQLSFIVCKVKVMLL